MHNDLDRIREALQFIPVGGHDERVRVAFMLKSELGETGRELWDQWRDSRGDDEAASVWKSASETGSLKIGTLFHEAKLSGWRDDRTHQTPTPEEIAQRKRISMERAAEEEATIARERADTAKKAAAILKAATEAKADHPYLSRKRISPVATLREIDASTAAAILGYAPKSGGDLLTGRLLVVPVKQGDGISTLELIDGDKRKAALAGRGSKVGGYWATERLPVGDGDGLTLLIGEGVATVLSASAASGHTAVASLSSGNLKTVAMVMRERYPAASLVFLADLVKATGEPDPHAIEAAREVGGKLAVPDFGTNRNPDMTDFNDLLTMGRESDMEQAITGAKLLEVWESQPSKNGIQMRPGNSVILVNGSDLTPVPVRWLWPGWLALGKFHILAGSPGQGKTTIALNMAATVTIGGRWPDGSRCEPGNVLIWSGEDDPADTLLPRLMAAGADISKCYFVSGTQINGESQPFDPARDMTALELQASLIGGVRLLMVDPVVSVVMGDSHKNAEVRRSLQPLVDLGSRLNAAVLGISHFSKGGAGSDPAQRVIGSVAFAAVARIVMVAAKTQSKDGEDCRILARGKSNIGLDDGGFEYHIEQAEPLPGIQASYIAWGAAVNGTARELLSETEESENDISSDELVEMMQTELTADCWTPAKDVFKSLADAGFSKDQVKRAAKRVGVIRQKSGMTGGWYWRLPGSTGGREFTEESTKGAKSAPIKDALPSHPSALHSLNPSDELEDAEVF